MDTTIRQKLSSPTVNDYRVFLVVFKELEGSTVVYFGITHGQLEFL